MAVTPRWRSILSAKRDIALASEEAQRLQRDEFWLREWRDEPVPLTALKATILTEEDWLEVAGFAFAHRPLLTSAGSLNRLLMLVVLPLPALRARLQQQDETALCRTLGLSGRKALLASCAKRRRRRCSAWMKTAPTTYAGRFRCCNFLTNFIS